MKLNNSIFKRYMIVSSAIIVVSFTLLGFVLMAFVGGYWGSEKQKLLTENAANVAEFSVDSIDSFGRVDQAMNTVLSVMGRNIDADIFLVNLNGRVIACSEMVCTHASKTVDPAILKQVLRGNYFENGRLGGMFDTNYYVAAAPCVRVNNSVVAFAFSVTPATGVDLFRLAILRLFIFSALLTAVVSFLAVTVMTYRMSRPLKQMSAAAKAFGQGDFSPRISVMSDDEIGDLAHAFNNMAISLSSLENMRRSFVANVSHELKTPMTTISGFIDGILDGTIPPDQQSHYLSIVSNEIKRLSRLVRSMLELSKIDSGAIKINPTDFDVRETILSTLLSFEAPIEQKNIQMLGLDKIKMMDIHADKDLIHQAVYNLIENAVKFTNEGGIIEISAFKGKNKFFFKIRNSGIGIPSHELSQVFERFYKTDKSRGIDKKGLGLGLFIVKTIINLHGGEIMADSIEGEFCEFQFFLPL